MSILYTIQVIGSDRADVLSELRRAVAAELQDVGVHRSIDVSIVEGVRRPTTPTVAVLLAGPSAKHNVAVHADVEIARGFGTVIIPVVDDLGRFSDSVPPGVSAFNGFEWSGNDPKGRLARILLEELDIEEKERRVFISHKREDGLGAAEQLHDALSHNRFKPFIDRFAIPPGTDVQMYIADALEDYAFLVVLETPQAHRSKWVFDEVDYALSHTMGLLIVQWPGNPPQVPGSRDVPRLTLTDADLTADAHGYDVLAEDALDRVMQEVEAAHARAIVRRRRMLILSVQEAARATGSEATPLRDWRLDVSAPRGRSVVAVAPRLPGPADLHKLDLARGELDPNASGLLVHAARRLAQSRKEHLTWVVGARNLKILPETAIGGYW